MPRTAVDVATVPLASGRPIRSAAGQTMGTTWSVKWHAKEGAAHPRQAIEAELARLVGQMSTWSDDSAITRINDAPLGSWQDVPDSLFEVLADSLDLARDSGGAFDPTVGSIVESWGFGPRRAQTAPPACDWRSIELDRAGHRLRRHADVRLDLSAIAKGDAVDRIAALMTRLGLSDHLIEIGGELRGSGVKPDWSPWWVGLESPPALDGTPLPADVAVALHGLSVATSGDYRHRVMRGGITQSHTVDPRSRLAVTNDLAAVSVIHASCRAADGLSTALLVMGLEQALAWAAARDIAAVFRRRTDAGFVDVVTPTLQAWSDTPTPLPDPA